MKHLLTILIVALVSFAVADRMDASGLEMPTTTSPQIALGEERVVATTSSLGSAQTIRWSTRRLVRPRRNGVRASYGSRGSMVAPISASSRSSSVTYGCTGSYSVRRRTFGSRGYAGNGFFAAPRKWWAGKNLGWQAPGTRRASRNACFSQKTGIPMNTTGPAFKTITQDFSYLMPVQENSVLITGTDWSWPGNLQQHMNSGPHWTDTSGWNQRERINEHNRQHENELGNVTWTPAMIQQSNQLCKVEFPTFNGSNA